MSSKASHRRFARRRYRRCKLTAIVRGKILDSIRAGGYAHVAAEAWGVPADILADWLKKGQAKGAHEPYASFAAEVREAEAQARLTAETRLFDKDGRAWLEHGPGRETADRPG